jgi:hypothetical protein
MGRRKVKTSSTHQPTKEQLKEWRKDKNLRRVGQLEKLAKAKPKAKSKSRVNEAGNYTKPTMRKRLFEKIKAGSKGGKPGQWSARKAQMLAREYKAAGGGYKS